MSDLTEFLLARIAEEEAHVLAVMNDAAIAGVAWPSAYRRMLADCEAKRRIVALHHPHNHHGEHGAYVFCDVCQWDRGDDTPRIDMGIEEFGNPCPTLRILATVYADHEDFRPEWRP